MYFELRQRISKMEILSQNLVGAFLDSINHTGGLESDIQAFLDERKGCHTLEELPECELKHIISRYSNSETSKQPQLSAPISRVYKEDLWEISYNRLLLCLAATVRVLPAFGGSPPNSFDEVPSPDMKRKQILHLAATLVRTREFCAGTIDGVELSGLNFLASLARLYGVRLEVGNALEDSNEEGVDKDVSRRGRTTAKVMKFERFHRGADSIAPFLRRFPTASDDFSSFALEIRRAHGTGREIE